MCACMPVCFQRNLMTFAKAHPAKMIFSPLVYNIIPGYIHCNSVSHYRMVGNFCGC